MVNLLTKIASKAKETVKNVGAVLNAAFNPFSKDKVVVSEKAAAILPKPVTKVLETAANHPYISAGVVAVAAAPAAAAAAVKTAAPTVLKVAKETISKHPLLSLGVAPIAATAVLKNPEGAATTVKETVEAQIDLGSVIANPSVPTAVEFVKEHPVFTGVAATAVAIPLAKTAIPAVASIFQTQAIKEQTKAIKDVSVSPIITTPEIPKTKEEEKVAAVTAAPEKPIAAETMPVYATTGTTTSKRRKKRSSKPLMQNFTQKTNVIVQNRNTLTGIRATKKYLNREQLIEL